MRRCRQRHRHQQANGRETGGIQSDAAAGVSRGGASGCVADVHNIHWWAAASCAGCAGRVNEGAPPGWSCESGAKSSHRIAVSTVRGGRGEGRGGCDGARHETTAADMRCGRQVRRLPTADSARPRRWGRVSRWREIIGVRPSKWTQRITFVSDRWPSMWLRLPLAPPARMSLVTCYTAAHLAHPFLLHHRTFPVHAVCSPAHVNCCSAPGP